MSYILPPPWMLASYIKNDINVVGRSASFLICVSVCVCVCVCVLGVAAAIPKSANRKTPPPNEAPLPGSHPLSVAVRVRNRKQT